MPDSPTRQSVLPALRRTLDFAAGQARRILDSYPGYSPMYTVGGKWGREGERWTHWCGRWRSTRRARVSG